MAANQSILKRVNDLYDQGHYSELIELGQDLWSKFNKKPSDFEIGECCRLIMLAHIAQNNDAQAEVWKARALTRFSLSQRPAGVAAMLIPIAFSVKDHPDLALLVFDEMEVLLAHQDNSNGLSASRYGMQSQRLLHEKRGFIYAFRKNEYDKAISEYNIALEYTGDDPRGNFKVRLGRALCYYLNGQTIDERQVAIDETQAIAKEMSAMQGAQFQDLMTITRHNLELMDNTDTAAIPELRSYEL